MDPFVDLESVGLVVAFIALSCWGRQQSRAVAGSRVVAASIRSRIGHRGTSLVGGIDGGKSARLPPTRANTGAPADTVSAKSAWPPRWRIWSPSAGTFLAFSCPWALIGPPSNPPLAKRDRQRPGARSEAPKGTCHRSLRCDANGTVCREPIRRNPSAGLLARGPGRTGSEAPGDRLRARVRADFRDADDRSDRLACHGAELAPHDARDRDTRRVACRPAIFSGNQDCRPMP